VAIPSVLKALNTWLVWRLKQVPGEDKPRKVPYYIGGEPREGVQGSPEDRKALAKFADAVSVYKLRKYDGIGLAMLADNGIVALDFDNCMLDGGGIDPRVARIIEGTYSEVSPSGKGVRAFFLGTMRSRKDNANKKQRVGGKPAPSPRLDGKFDIEFFGDSGYVTVTGRRTPDAELWDWPVIELTDAVKDLYKERFGTDGRDLVMRAQDGAAFDDILTGLSDRQGWTLEQAREVLNAIDPSMSREDWLFALMALHHEFEGSEDALDLADEWSGKANNYDSREDVEGRWRSFRTIPGQAPITARWLLHRRNEELKKQKYSAEEEWVTKINETHDAFVLREKLCIEIAQDQRLDEPAREIIAQALRIVFKGLGKTYPIAQVRKMLEPPRNGGGPHAHHETEPPDWMKAYVYVTDDDKFYKQNSDEWLTVQGFNAKFNRYMPTDENGDVVQNASTHALEDCRLNVVTRAFYIPWAGSLFDLDGVPHVNRYRPSTVPEAVQKLSAEGRAAVELVLTHIRLICGNRPGVMQYVMDWLAHNVQNPGVKIRWAILIKGIEGDGKTLLAQLLSAMMGKPNIKQVSPKVLGTDFTSWGTGSCVAVLEEIKLTGHNRYDILNALKPYITNDSVEIHQKGKDTYDAPNTVNYLAFTNFADALPLNDTERRWMILNTPFSNIEAMAAMVREALRLEGADDAVLDAYFEALFAAIHTQASELRRYFLDWKIGASFKANGRAPMTQEKQAMIGMNQTEEESAVMEALEIGGPGVTRDLFSSSALLNLVMASDAEFSLNTSGVPVLLKKMGYTKFPVKVKWQNKAHHIWVRNLAGLDNFKIRETLDRTLSGCVALPDGGNVDDLFS
jgi:hypothetical protein